MGEEFHKAKKQARKHIRNVIKKHKIKLHVKAIHISKKQAKSIQKANLKFAKRMKKKAAKKGIKKLSKKVVSTKKLLHFFNKLNKLHKKSLAKSKKSIKQKLLKRDLAKHILQKI